MFDLEVNIENLNNYLDLKGLNNQERIDIEKQLRDEILNLTNKGLTQDEAFLIAMKRLSIKYNTCNDFFMQTRQKLLANENSKLGKKKYQEILLLIIFSLIAGTLFKIPDFIGQDVDELFYIKNISIFILPLIAIYFIMKRKLNKKLTAIILGIFFIGLTIVNLYPTFDPHHTKILSVIHLSLFLWLITGISFIGPRFKESKERMNFIRFTGECFIYGVLMVCGLIVLCLFIVLIFSAIGIDLESIVFQYIFIYGLCASSMITIYLVEAKRGIVETFAPILAKIFSPLFLVTLLIFLLVILFTRNSIFTDRDYLIGFDLMLALVLGLVMYSISSRSITDKKNIFDYINLALIISAFIIDIIALAAILVRLQTYGISPNKIAALGENLVLLGNLVLLSWQYLRYMKNKVEFSVIEKIQTDYLSVYAIWFAIVAFIFPILFGFI